MKHYLCILSGVLLLAGLSCSDKTAEREPEPWTVRMANSIMATSDQLAEFESINSPDNKYGSEQWDYDVAFLGLAIRKLKGIDPKYGEYADGYINHFVQADGGISGYDQEEFNIDRINPGKNLFPLYKETEKEKYRLAIERLVEQMKAHPKTESGGYWHKKIYPQQMWLDGIFMAGPFLAQYGKVFDQPQWFDVVAEQIRLIYDKTRDPETGLLYHAYNESKKEQWADPETGKSPQFWGRAIGWYLMGIVDVLDYLPKDHPKRNEILKIFRKTVDAVIKVRDEESGVWYQIVDKPGQSGNYPEASCTAMFTYSIAKGASMGHLPGTYLGLANSCFDAMIEAFVKIDENGSVKLSKICGGAGLGGTPYRDGSFEYYISEEIVINDCKGVAPFILAALELHR